jgi:hypothetical protein
MIGTRLQASSQVDRQELARTKAREAKRMSVEEMRQFYEKFDAQEPKSA